MPPIYEYECSKCEMIIEQRQKYEDDPPKCPLCKKKTERLLSAGGFVLKGKGFYNESND